MTDRVLSLDTLAVHAGDLRPRIFGAVVAPIFQTANFVHSGDEEYHELRYVRLNNTPGHEVVAARLAALEGSEDTLVAGSGMSAITTALLSVAGSGDHVLFSRLLYGGTRNFVVRQLPGFGIEYDLVDPASPDGWRERLRPETRAIYVESISNPTVRVADLEAVLAFGRDHGLVTMVDNTFASPVNYRPIEHGFDLCLHSATKYLNGHSDVAAGVVAGSAEALQPIRERLNILGGTLDPHACFLLGRGLATLGLRVRRQNETALALATMLAADDRVRTVNYPGLPGHPDHERARRLFAGYGGMLSFELAGQEAAERFMSALRIVVPASSLGGVHSLATRPAATSHTLLTPEERTAEGIPDGLVRLSVGVEDASDLAADLAEALAAAG